MANQEHLDILAKGVDAWNRWRSENPHVWGIDLSDAQLPGGHLFWLQAGGRGWITGGFPDPALPGYNLVGVNLKRTHLDGANLYRANLSQADLTESTLIEANLSHTCLRGAKLNGANLQGTLVEGADLRDAEFTGTQMRDVIFGDTDLNGAKGLEACKHWGPSCLDERTLVKSPSLPIAFLRGCGLSERLIEYLPSLLNHPFEFYSSFISYSTKDQEFADRLYADLQARGVRCWFAPHDIQGGRKVHEQIDEAIRVYDKLVLILSDASMNSPWVKTEIANARAREEQQKRQMLFPISLVPFDQVKEWKLFDADRGIDSAREIREYFIPDFSNWKDHDSYQQAFDRLVRDLKAGDLYEPERNQEDPH